MNKETSVSQLMQQSQVSFGTSGARGLVINMTDKICYSYTTAFIKHLQQSKQIGHKKIIAIAGDLRPSTRKIMNACAKAILDMNLEVINCGYIASSAIALYGINQEIATIMVTGSHIPDDRNGIKFNTCKGEILKEDEIQIKKQSIKARKDLFCENGQLLNKVDSFLPAINMDARNQYINRFTQLFPEQPLIGMNIGVYQHSGVARDDIVDIMVALGANAQALNRSELFIPVDTEAIREDDILLAKQWSDKYQFDAIISTDGDADRPLISDEKGNWLRGDIIGILCGKFLGIKHIVTPVSSNTAVEKCALFDSVSRTKIGSPYVIAQMNKLLKQGFSGIAGYEANGGFLLADDVAINGKQLSALPTRDAVIVLLSLLILSKQNNCSISELTKDLPQRFTYSDRIKNIPAEISQQIISTYLDKTSGIKKIEMDFNGAFATPSSVSKIDNTDGLRIYFKNKNIIHFRASGNAPEFRCYSEAEETEIAQSINHFCLQKIKSLAK